MIPPGYVWVPSANGWMRVEDVASQSLELEGLRSLVAESGGLPPSDAAPVRFTCRERLVLRVRGWRSTVALWIAPWLR